MNLIMRRILLVEDESVVALEMEKRLEKMGYDVVASVSYGEEAVAKAEETSPDLILMDVQLEGEMDGIDAAGEIHKRLDIPVLYLTAYSDDETLKRAKLTEPFGYLLKPFQERELSTFMEIALFKHGMERRLREREQYLDTILRSHTDALIATNTEGIIKFINPLAERLTGWPDNSAVGREITEVLTIKRKIDSRYRDISVKELLNTNDTPIMGKNTLLMSKQGMETYISCSTAPIPDKNEGVDRGNLFVIRDISERIYMEESLLILYKAIGVMQTGLTITGADGIIRYTNNAVDDMHGYIPGELIGKDVRVFSPNDRQNLPGMEELMKLQSWSRESINIRKDGTLFPVYLKSDFVSGESGDPIAVVTSCEDIRERKEMEEKLKSYNEHLESEVKKRTSEISELYEELVKSQEQLIQSEKLASIGQLAAGIAHEINNPLGFVHSNIGNLQKFTNKILGLLENYELFDLPEKIRSEVERQKEQINYDYIKERLKKIIERSKHGIDRMKEIVQGLKTFSRVDASELNELNINNALDISLSLMANEYKNRIEIVRNYGDIPEVSCYCGKINQVLINLLINACQAIKGSGEIRIDTSAEGHMVSIEISDTGVGIPEEILDKIFDPFFTTKPVGTGTGLGLSISRNIIKQHKGELSVQSEEGKGSRFIIRLPVDPQLPEVPQD